MAQKIDTAIYAPTLAPVEIPLQRISPDAVSPQLSFPEGAVMPRISDDGRFVAFSSASQLKETDTDNASDVYLFDRASNTITHVSTQNTGSSLTGDSNAALSANGRFVVYTTADFELFLFDRVTASLENISDTVGAPLRSIDNISVTDVGDVVFQSVADHGSGDSFQTFDIYYYSRASNSLSWISSDAQGVLPGDSTDPDMSASGRFIVYTSENDSNGSSGGDSNDGTDVFIHDQATGLTKNLSHDLVRGAGLTSHDARNAQVSDDGRFVAFNANPEGQGEVFLWDSTTGTAASISEAATPSGSAFGSGLLDMSDNGEFIVFYSINNGLVPGDNDGAQDLFIYERATKTIRHIGPVEDEAGLKAQITDNGNVLFETRVSQSESDNNGSTDVHLWDRSTGSIARVTTGSGGARNGQITPDGQSVVFQSSTNGLVAGDNNNANDVFLASTNGLILRRAIEEGRHLSFDLQVSGTTGVTIDWGDGHVESQTLSGSTQTINLAHIYRGSAGFGVPYEGTVTLTAPGEAPRVYSLNPLIWGDGEPPSIEPSEDGKDSLVFATTNKPRNASNHPDNYAYGGQGNDVVFGWTGDDMIHGWGGDDVINGMSGNDILYGESPDLTFMAGGNDVLDGGDGDDVMYGGSGNDTYLVGSKGDKVNEYDDQGTDTVIANVDYALDKHNQIEIMRAAEGTASIDLAATSLNNTLFGNAGNNRLDGKRGADTLLGMQGKDSYVVDHIRDKVIETISATSSKDAGGIDTVTSSVSFSLMKTAQAKGRIEHLTLTGSASSGTGNDFGDTITGNSKANALKGLDGKDTLKGNGGNDQLDGGLGSDTLTGGKGSSSDDTFVFSTVIKAKGDVDTITDFEKKYDQIFLDDRYFKGLEQGKPGGVQIDSYMFVANKSGQATSDDKAQIVYETDTGKLFYDKDGEGGAKAIHFATLKGKPALAYSDFEII